MLPGGAVILPDLSLDDGAGVVAINNLGRVADSALDTPRPPVDSAVEQASVLAVSVVVQVGDPFLDLLSLRVC